ncbi:MAG: glycosyltransferase [Microgenomates group bacterium]
MLKNKKIAIVYDWIDKWGGVERVLLTLHEMFPNAPFFTSHYDPQRAVWAKNLTIKTSFIQKLPVFIRRSRFFSFPLYPFAFESFDFSSFDVVISVTSSFAKSIITKPKTFHLCYLLTPTRYLWFMNKEYHAPKINYLKKWDYVAAQRPDKIISISKTVAQRCQRYYKRKSEVIYPPFDIDYWGKIKSEIRSRKLQIHGKFKILNSKQFFLIVSRLEPYKKVDLVVQSFNQLNYQLVVIGEGSQKNKLKKIAGKNVIFLSGLTDQELGWFYSNAKVLIMPQEEDFGYTALEAQFFGCPVIAYKKGGARETIIDGKTGLFFNEQTEESLIGALERFQTIAYNLTKSTQAYGLKNIEKFNKTIFVERFMEVDTDSHGLENRFSQIKSISM